MSNTTTKVLKVAAGLALFVAGGYAIGWLIEAFFAYLAKRG